MTLADINRFNRQMLPEGSVPADTDPADLYRFVFGVDDRLTEVHERIPQRAGQSVS